ncbi:MAG: hypothetical protein JSR00_05200 [Bacteroidetes bacterium]|nr:hypothetical protein [Bacteroidota bacterium]
MKDDVINTDTKNGNEIPMPKKVIKNMVSKFQSAGDGKFVTVDELKALREKKKARQNSSK